MEKLSELIKQAYESNCASASYREIVVVEINGGIPIYTISGVECTATQAINKLDELCG